LPYFMSPTRDAYDNHTYINQGAILR
jgi:hypothetical protein